MTIQISASDAAATIDSLETAIAVLTDELDRAIDDDSYTDYTAPALRRSIEDLKMIRVSYMLLARNGGRINKNILPREAFLPTRCDRNCQCPECRQARTGEAPSDRLMNYARNNIWGR